MMKASVLALTIALAVLTLAHNAEAGQEGKHNGFSITIGPERTIDDCSQVRLKVRDAAVVRAEQAKTIPRNSISSLQVQAPHHGGIYIQGWDRNEYSIKACLGAAGDSPAEAKAIIDQLSLSIQDGKVTVQGPSGETWVGYLLVQAPNGASLELGATNGPISLNAISASVRAQTTNGPISFNDVSGQVHAHAQNGPINVSGNKGEFHVETQNGPIGVELTGNQWESGELEASAQNGPLSLMLPPNYRSSVRVEASRYSPVECRAVQCKQAMRTWDKPNIIEFGDAPPVIRMSTVNGPLRITSTGDKREN
jgi:Putative adhesin